jgi:hypothetical protein
VNVNIRQGLYDPVQIYTYQGIMQYLQGSEWYQSLVQSTGRRQEIITSSVMIPVVL